MGYSQGGDYLTLTLLKLSDDLKTQGVTTTRLLTCHCQDCTRIKLILRYNFSDPQVSRDVCNYYRRKAILESHMRQFIIEKNE